MNETSDLATLLAPLWRRKWLVLGVAAVVAVGTYLYYHRQVHVYSASTQLDLGNGLETQQLAGGSQNRTTLNSRALGDAAALIGSSVVTEAVRARLRGEGRSASKLGKVRARVLAESYVVTITAEAHSAKQAARLANDYALAYIEGQHTRYRGEVQAAIANTRRQLHRIEAAQATATGRHGGSNKGGGSSRASAVSGSSIIQESVLASKINQLESDLSVSSIQQVTPSKPRNAQLVSPKPRQNAIFGFVIALLLIGAIVLGLTRFDRRIHSLGQLEAIFKARVLSALPRESEPIDYSDGQPRPAATLLEPLRRLHTAIQLGNMLEPGKSGSPRLVLFLSPDSGDGKSTLTADLALVQRDAGARVAVLEADLRQPAQAGLLAVNETVGLAEVLSGDLPLDQAMQGVGATSAPQGMQPERVASSVATVTRAGGVGSLSVLVSGRPVTNPPALLASQDMRDLLNVGTADYDYVLIDAPPPLRVSDVIPLLHWVDAIIIVARLEHTHQAAAEGLARLLADSPTAPVLGVVANGISRAEVKRSGLASS